MALAYLPSDILFNVFTLLDDLQDLNAVVITNNSLHQTFQDQRSAILRNVFTNQLTTWLDTDRTSTKYKGGIQKATRFVKYVNTTLSRCSMNADRLTLHIAAWDIYLDFKSLPWLITTLPLDLVACCEALNRSDLALSYIAVIWERVLADDEFKLRLHRNHSTTLWRVKVWAMKLAEQYHNQGSSDAAIDIIMEWCTIGETVHDRQIVQPLTKYASNRDSQERIVRFFTKRVQDEQELLERNVRRSRAVQGDISWTYSLLELLIQFGKYKDASNVFGQVNNIFSGSSLNPMLLVGRSRGLIKILVDKNVNELALEIYQAIFVLLSGMSQNTPSHYLGWASSYVSLLYQKDMMTEALIVEEECWNQIREHLLRTRRTALSYSGQNAAFTLYRSYEQRGQIEQAKRVRWEYESLIKECETDGNTKQIIWPGDAADSSYFTTHELNKHQRLESSAVNLVAV